VADRYFPGIRNDPEIKLQESATDWSGNVARDVLLGRDLYLRLRQMQGVFIIRINPQSIIGIKTDGRKSDGTTPEVCREGKSGRKSTWSL